MKSKLTGLYHLGRIDSGHNDLTEDHYDRMIADMRRQQERDAEQDAIDTDLNESANETRGLD